MGVKEATSPYVDLNKNKKYKYWKTQNLTQFPKKKKKNPTQCN